MTTINLQEMLNTMFVGKTLIVNGKKYDKPIQMVQIGVDKDDNGEICLYLENMYVPFSINENITVE